MRIIVVSDTHRDLHTFLDVAARHEADADMFLHLGDGYSELMDLENLYPDKVWKGVLGNCDFSRYPGSREEDIALCGNAHIFYTHGHLYGVKYGLESLFQAGREKGADVILYGHTHIAHVEYREGIYLMNPGSLGQPRRGNPSYGIVDITPQGIVCHTVQM